MKQCHDHCYIPESLEAYNQTSHLHVPDCLLCLWLHLGIPWSLPLLVPGGSWLHQAYYGNIFGHWNCGWNSTHHCQWSNYKEVWVINSTFWFRILYINIWSFRNCNVIVFALALYSLRLLGYSFIESPLESLFFEVISIIFYSHYSTLYILQILKPFGNSLLLIAAMTYAKNNADIENMASLEVRIT